MEKLEFKGQRVELLVFLVLLLVHIFPFLSLDYFLTQDSPSHLYNSQVLNSVLFDHSTKMNEYYQLDFNGSPNFIAGVFYSLFGLVFSYKLSYIIVHLLIWILFPLSVLYVIRYSNPKNQSLAILSLPLLYTFPFILGFDSFCLGLSFSLFLYGFWLRKRFDTTLKSKVLLLLFSALLYFTHLVSICFFLLLVILKSIAPEKGIDNQAKPFINPKQLFSQLWPLTPLVGILLIYFSDSRLESSASASISFDRFIQLDDLNLFWSAIEGKYLKYLAQLIVLLFFGSQVWAFFQKEKNRPSIGWITVLLLLLLYFYTPDALAGGSFISNRLILLFLISAIIAAAKVNFNLWLKFTIIILSGFISLTLLQDKYSYFKKCDEEVGRFMSVLSKVEDHSTLLYLNFHPSGVDQQQQAISYGKGLFHHAVSFISFEKEDVVLLKNYETYHSYFPVKWEERKSANTDLACAPFSMANVPPCVDFEKYQSKGEEVDYVFVYKHPDQSFEDDNTIKMFQYLADHYELVEEEKEGIIRLYKKI